MARTAEDVKAELFENNILERWVLLHKKSGEFYLLMRFVGGITFRAVYPASPCLLPRPKKVCGNDLPFCAPFEPAKNGGGPSGCRMFYQCREWAKAVEAFPEDIESVVRLALMKR